MGFFTPSEAAYLAASTVRVATLLELQFEGEPCYLWNGFGQRSFGAPGFVREYVGCGDLISIEGMEEVRSVVSQQVTFTLSGVQDSPAGLLDMVLNSGDLVQGRQAIVSLQLFDDNFAAVGAPLPIYFGLMMPPRVTHTRATETSGATRTIALPTENIFYGRHRPPAGRFTDKEQQQRFPGDRFCEFTPQLVNLSLTWPDY